MKDERSQFRSSFILHRSSSRTARSSMECTIVINNDMTIRTTAGLLHATPQLEGEGMLVTRPFSTARLDQLDPFLLLAHMCMATHWPGEAEGTTDDTHSEVA